MPPFRLSRLASGHADGPALRPPQDRCCAPSRNLRANLRP